MKNIRILLIEKLRVHITLTFFFFLYSSTYYLGQNKHIFPVIVAFTLWHFSVYLFNKSYDIEEDKESKKGVISEYERVVFKYIASASLLIPIVILYYFNFIIYPYLFVVPLGLLYSIPMGGRKTFRIKNLFVWKNIYASLATVGVPYIALYFYASINLNDYGFLQLILLYIFLIFLVIEILSDIPDMKGDLKANVMTIPNRLGINKTKYIIYATLSMAAGISIIIQNYFLLILPIFIIFTLRNLSPNNTKFPIGFLFYGFLILFSILALTGLLYRF